MNEQIQAILDRLEALQAEMAEHRTQMRKLLERDDREWAIELEKYYTARESLLEADKELAVLLRSSERAAQADGASTRPHCGQIKSLCLSSFTFVRDFLAI
jgi:hypothetical protein